MTKMSNGANSHEQATKTTADIKVLRLRSKELERELGLARSSSAAKVADRNQFLAGISYTLYKIWSFWRN